MIDEKKIPEFIETSVVWMLSAVVAALGFLLVWLVCMLAGFGESVTWSSFDQLATRHSARLRVPSRPK